MHLSDCISENMESIVQAWEDFARTIEPPALTMDRSALRDHASAMLRVIAKDLTFSQTASEQSEKSKGQGPRDNDDTAAEAHADARLLSGFGILPGKRTNPMSLGRRKLSAIEQFCSYYCR